MANAISREKAGLAGPVRSVLTDVANWYRTTVHYDANGNLIEQIAHNKNGTLSRATYVYDAAGRVSEMQAQLDGVPSGRTIYLYDADGRLSYELSLRADGSEGQQTRRFYDADGSYTEEFTLDRTPDDHTVLVSIDGSGDTASAEKASFIRTRRDAAGKPLEMRFYDPSGSMLYRFVYHYNARGVLTDMEQRTGDQPLLNLPEGGEPAGGLLREFAALFSPDTALSTVRYRYDEQGRRTESATWVGANCIERRAFEYDEHGDKAAERRYGADGRLQSDIVYERERDQHGNWIVETVLEAGIPVSTTRRTIEYET